MRITSWDIARWCYAGPVGGHDPRWRPTPAQHKAVVRAMHTFIAKFPQYVVTGGQGRTRLALREATAAPGAVTDGADGREAA